MKIDKQCVVLSDNKSRNNSYIKVLNYVPKIGKAHCNLKIYLL